MMLHVNAFIKDLAETNGDRFQDAEPTVEQRRSKIAIVDEIVGDAVDVPRNAYRIDEPENEHAPERDTRKQVEHSEKIGALQNASQDRDCVPASVGKDFGIGRRSFNYDNVFRFHGSRRIANLARLTCKQLCRIARVRSATGNPGMIAVTKRSRRETRPANGESHFNGPGAT